MRTQIAASALLLAATLAPAAASPEPDAVLRQLGVIANANYITCLQEARYAIALRIQLATAGEPPSSQGIMRLKDCTNRARYAIAQAMPTVREATTTYPRAAALVREWGEAWGRSLDRLNADANSPNAQDTPDALPALTALLRDAEGQLRW